MKEISRIIIEEYCRDHKPKKSRQLERLVEMSYDLYCEGTDDDAILLEKLIEKEKNEELRKALVDLEGFIPPWPDWPDWPENIIKNTPESSGVGASGLRGGQFGFERVALSHACFMKPHTP